VTLVDAAGRRGEVSDPRALHVALPAGSTALDVTALDEHGNRVWDGPAPRPPVVVTPPPPHHPPPPPPPPRPTPLFARWTTWAITTGVALAGGGFCAWRFKTAQDDWNLLRADPVPHDYSQLVAVEARGRHWALATDISFGVAAATALAASIALLAHHSEPVTVTVTPSSVGLAARF